VRSAASMIGVEVLKVSEQSLGQLLPPVGADRDWIDRAAEHELKLRLGFEDPTPACWDTPVAALLPITSVGESKDPRGRNRRPWSVLVVLRPHPVFGPRRSDGKPAIPAAVWHEGFDWGKESWFDFGTGEPTRRIHVGHRVTGEQARVLTYAEAIRKHFSRVPERVLGPDTEPATEKTLGLLEPAPTEVSIVRLIGREMNLLDRAGITTNPEYSDYTGENKPRGLALRVLRVAGVRQVATSTGFAQRTVRRFLSSGRTSLARWSAYMDAATEIATKELTLLSRALPTNDEARWGLYERERRRCRCGIVLKGKQQKWCSTCRSSAGRLRQGRFEH
jgi:hypothetical protein